MRADVDPLNNTHFHTDRLFGLWVSPDFNTPGRYAPYLLQGGLGMPDRDYYLDTSPRMVQIRAQYQAHVATVLGMAGIPDGKAKAARIVELERAIANVHASLEDSQDVRKANNPWKRSAFAGRALGLDWTTFFRAAGLDGQSTVIVWHPGAITGLSALIASVPLATWKEYLTFHEIDRRSNILPRAFVAERFAFHEKILSGTPENEYKDGLLSIAAGYGYKRLDPHVASELEAIKILVLCNNDQIVTSEGEKKGVVEFFTQTYSITGHDGMQKSLALELYALGTLSENSFKNDKLPTFSDSEGSQIIKITDRTPVKLNKGLETFKAISSLIKL